METEKLNDSFGDEDRLPKSLSVCDHRSDDKSDDKSDDRSDNTNLFNRVNLRPFELHSNTTSANVSRKNSFMNKTQDDPQVPTNVSLINTPHEAQDGSLNLSENVSRNNSFLN